MRAKVMIWAAILALLTDQVSKYLVVRVMDVANRGGIDVLAPLLRFRYGENTGINFGLFGGGTDTTRWVLIGLSLVICVVLVIWIARLPANARMMQLSAGLVIGGALGNVVDRLLYGYVLDFLNMSCCGINNPFVFNVADIFIFAGAAGLILFDGRQKNPA
ncbi:signal peptidase II [Phaeobacter gallaeciensis]|uniref:Lipoprotein signal peptidase n=1 Tax=Phaeobacter gallaeciensis TaxID=60890 RepID=A0AAD0EEJ6_9RHOB|nr:signal peptidase II [Phaeobacter gallaeciensis]AHD11064.1 lipoprotein signal peptidase [Phaeobacter gallaeciensis DSM 26640]ATE94327.1 lipoprotein signal peptidase [Phaeobacter gallaeciensis]ATE98600.1 lipoprotein signal peptidase [Phaeobacter gallaeciensis]ATF02991.1 lipoprotein signal peptidase [Phaeobacter gallaeciensis]ATF07371.1 lipoprotein signal peptidase [Phaeobacter gallaeciensis]